MRLMYENLVDLSETTLSASSQAAGYPVSLIKDTLRKRAWRATDSTQEHVIMQVPAGKTVSAFAITGHNLSLTATVELWKSANGSTYTYVDQIDISPSTASGYGVGFYGYGGYGGTDQSGVLVGSTQALFFTGVSSTSFPYWKAIFKDPNSADFYIKCGRIFLGNYWEPTNQIIPGWRIEIVDETEISTLVSQQKVNNEKAIFERVTFSLPHLSVADAFDNFICLAIRTFKVTKRDVFLALFPQNTISIFQKDVTTVYGRFVGNEIGVSHVASSSFTTGELTFEESL